MIVYRYFAAILLTGFLVDIHSAWAENWIRVPEDAATIQAAVERCANGDVISLASAVYSETIHIANKEIALKGREGEYRPRLNDLKNPGGWQTINRAANRKPGFQSPPEFPPPASTCGVG